MGRDPLPRGNRATRKRGPRARRAPPLATAAAACARHCQSRFAARGAAQSRPTRPHVTPSCPLAAASPNRRPRASPEPPSRHHCPPRPARAPKRAALPRLVPRRSETLLPLLLNPWTKHFLSHPPNASPTRHCRRRAQARTSTAPTKLPPTASSLRAASLSSTEAPRRSSSPRAARSTPSGEVSPTELRRRSPPAFTEPPPPRTSPLQASSSSTESVEPPSSSRGGRSAASDEFPHPPPPPHRRRPSPEHHRRHRHHPRVRGEPLSMNMLFPHRFPPRIAGISSPLLRRSRRRTRLLRFNLSRGLNARFPGT